MQRRFLIAGLIILASCSGFDKPLPESKPVLAKIKKTSTSKKLAEVSNLNAKSNINGTLNNGTLFVATPDIDGYVLSFDPFIPKNDEIFVQTTKQLIAKLYNDKIKGQSNVSVETNIDYIIFKGKKARYKIVPYKESNGEISSLSIVSMK